MSNPKYCFWSVCDGTYGAMMEHCVYTARRAGVFKEFHVLTDRPVEGCECYDAYQCDKAHGLFKLHYLKVGMSRLNFDCFVWLDADTGESADARPARAEPVSVERGPRVEGHIPVPIA